MLLHIGNNIDLYVIVCKDMYVNKTNKRDHQAMWCSVV